MKLLKERQITPTEKRVNLINPVVDLESIPESARTTGNEWLDLGLNTAIKFADKLHETKRKNEIAELEIKKIERLNSYEAEWSGKDRYSDDNYEEYLKGLNSILDENMALSEGTKYLSKDDVNSWRNSAKMDKASKQYEAQGKKAEYDIKFNIDKTMINYQGLMMNYANARSEKEADTYLKQGMELLNTLNPFINDGELLKMQFTALTDAQTQRTQRQITSIINSSMSTREKREALANFKEGLKSSEVYDKNASELVRKGIIPKEMQTAFASASRDAIQSSTLQAGGYISKLEAQIRDEEYRIREETERAKILAMEDYKKGKLALDDALLDGDFGKVVNMLEDEPYTMEDILTSPSITEKYLGKTPKQVINEGGFIPSMDRDTLNQLLEEKNKDDAGGIPRNLTVGSVMGRITQTENPEIQQNQLRELYSRNVISQAEYGLYNQGKSEMIDYLSIGEKNAKSNKVSLSNFAKNDPLANQLRALPYEQGVLAVQALHGAVESGKFDVLMEAGDKFDSVSLKRAYNSSETFRNYTQEVINAFSNVELNKYQKARINKEKAFDIYDTKKTKGIKNRLKTVEKGLQPVVQLQQEDELLGWE